MQLFAVFELHRLELWFLRKLQTVHGLFSAPVEKGGEEG